MAIATLVVDLVLKTGKLGAQVSNALAPVGKKLTSFGVKATAAISAPIVGIGVAISKAAIDFESGVAGMVKTVDGMADATGRLTTEGETLVSNLREMSKEVPVTFSTLSRIGELAGQLGVPMDQIEEFTLIIAKLGATTDLSYEAAATQIAKFANITGMADTDVERYASTVVHLGNNLATTETELVAMTLRLAGLGPTLDIQEKDLLAWGGAMSSVGIRAEMGGSALTKAFATMNEAVSMGGEELDLFAETAGMSTDEFVELFKTDASEAMRLFIVGLDKFKKAGGDAFLMLDDLGLGQIRVRDTLLRLSGASETLNEAFALSNEGWEENVALSREAGLRFQTSASQIQMLKNTVRDLATEAGLILVPILIELVEAVKPILTSVMEWIRENPELTKTIMAIAGAAAIIGPALIVVGGIISAVGTAATVVSAVLTPLGLVIAAIIAAITALGAAFAADFGGVRTAAQELWAELQPILSDIGLAILDVIDVVSEILKPLILDAVDSIQKAFAALGIESEDVWGAIGAVIKFVAIGAGMVILGLVMVVSGAAIAIATALDVAANGFRMLSETVRTVIDFITGGLASAKESVQGFVDGVIGGFQGLYDNLVGHSVIPDLVRKVNLEMGNLTPTLGALTGITAVDGTPGAVAGGFAGQLTIINNWDASLSSADRAELSAMMEDTTYRALGETYGG